MFTEEQSKVITNSFVGICTPCYGGAVHEKHYVSVVSFVIASMKNNMNFTLETMANESLVTRARNNLVAKCMSNKQITHILFIDADVGFDVDHQLCCPGRRGAWCDWKKRGWQINPT